MLWLVVLLALACALIYVWIIRPILKQQPMLSAAFKAEASLWQKVQAKLVAVDGHPVQPFSATSFPITMAQRLDLELPHRRVCPAHREICLYLFRPACREREFRRSPLPGSPAFNFLRVPLSPKTHDYTLSI